MVYVETGSVCVGTGSVCGDWVCLWRLGLSVSVRKKKAKLSAVTQMFTDTSIHEYCHVIMFLH